MVDGSGGQPFVTEGDPSRLRPPRNVIDHVTVDAASGPGWNRL
jgi:hypothetical protein